MAGFVTPEQPKLHTRVVEPYCVLDTREGEAGKIFCGKLVESIDQKTCEVECAKFTVPGTDIVLADGEFEPAACPVDGCEIHPDIDAVRPLANTSWNNEEIRGKHAFVGDVEMSFLISSPDGTSRALQMIGLDSNPDQSAGITVDHAFYVYKINGTRRLYIRENGTQPFTVPQALGGFWVNGDKLTIRRIGETVTYLVNDVLVYTSLVPSTEPLCMDSTFYSQPTGAYAVGTLQVTEIKTCSI